MNISKVNLIQHNPLPVSFPQTVFVVSYIAFVLFVLFVGTALHAGIISFERYGGDPQKRGLVNEVTEAELNIGKL